MPQQAFDTHYRSVTAFIHDNFQGSASLFAASFAVAVHLPSFNYLSLTLSNQLAVTLKRCSKEHAQMQHRRLQLTSHIKQIVVGVQHRAIDRVDGG